MNEQDTASPWPECANHIEVQHRDARPPWCRTCGWHRGGTRKPAVKVKDV